MQGRKPVSQSETERAWPLAQGPTRADWAEKRRQLASGQGETGEAPSCSRSTGPRHELETPPPFPRALGTLVVPSQNPRMVTFDTPNPPVWPIPLAERARAQTSVVTSSPSSSITSPMLDQEMRRGNPVFAPVARIIPLSSAAAAHHGMGRGLSKSFLTMQVNVHPPPEIPNATVSRQPFSSGLALCGASHSRPRPQHLERSCQKQKQPAPSVQLGRITEAPDQLQRSLQSGLMSFTTQRSRGRRWPPGADTRRLGRLLADAHTRPPDVASSFTAPYSHECRSQRSACGPAEDMHAIIGKWHVWPSIVSSR